MRLRFNIDEPLWFVGFKNTLILGKVVGYLLNSEDDEIETGNVKCVVRFPNLKGDLCSKVFLQKDLYKHRLLAMKRRDYLMEQKNGRRTDAEGGDILDVDSV